MGNTYTSKKIGNWSRTSENEDSPWYDAGDQSGWAACPGNGDLVIFDHAVHADVSAIIGTSPTDQTTMADVTNPEAAQMK
ncbi:MAG: hypothetical protein M0R22_04430 [Dehalococcoidia bacterium]|jgi:hypothetical protein|nr:hypothetical protein [Dehalococcoidia bacterium]